MQTLRNPFDWMGSVHLYWPDDDKKLNLVNNWVYDVDRVVEHCEKRGTVIQAGGACGVWPSRLAMYFKQVVTFEPCPENYMCLQENTKQRPNVTAYYGGLSSAEGSASLSRDQFEDGNAGAWYVTQGDSFPMKTIDSMGLDVGLIMLDVEGSELEALRGAKDTLTRCKPVVCLEQKQLPHMTYKVTESGAFLESMGYQQVAKYHNDVVFTC